MGHRANLIVIENGENTLRYDHWIANRLDKILFWGAHFALKYFEAQEIVDENGWLDNVWAEGGAVIDLDNQHLLWYGGEDVKFELPLRKTFLDLQKRVWRDWKIEWAHRGIVDLTEYVGVPGEKVIAARNVSPHITKLEVANPKSWVRTIGSICLTDGDTKIFPLGRSAEDYLQNGADLVEQCRQSKGFETIVWSDWDKDETGFPSGGFHLDEKKRIVEFWKVGDSPNTVNEIKRVWNDWDVIWHQDDYEFQLTRTAHEIILPSINEDALIERLRSDLLGENNISGVDSFLQMTKTIERENKSIEVNPWALKSYQVENPLETKKQIWEKLFSK